MIFYILWNYLVGYVKIRVDGLSLEKFINLTVGKGIRLWGINRESYTSLTANMGMRDFHQLHSISHKIRCRIRIEEKRGLPFVMHRYRHRKMLVVGMIAFLVILYGFSCFIWSVDVQGVKKMDPQKIWTELDSLGVRPGVYKKNIDTMSVENSLIVTIPELSWASLEIKGSRAILRVREATQPPDFVDKETPSDIIASRDGIIQSMIVLDGQAVVEDGQTVRKGQLLVTGIIDHPDSTGIRYVHSMGQIKARTWYEDTAELSLKQPYRQRTGRSAQMKYIGWNRFKVPYRKEEIPFEDYDVEVREDGILITETYYEVKKIHWEQDRELAKEKVKELIEEKIREKIPQGAKVIDKKFKYDMIEGEKLTALVYIEALEDIGQQRIIETQ